MANYRCRLTFTADDGQNYLKEELVEASDEVEAKSKAEERHLIRNRKEGSMAPAATLQGHMTTCEYMCDS